MTRADRKHEKRLAQIRRAARRHREKVKAEREAAEKAKRLGGTIWRRPFDPRPQAPPVSITPEEEARSIPEVPVPVVAPQAPPKLARPPKLTTLERRLAADRLRQDRAVARALKADDRILAELGRLEEEAEEDRDKGPISEGDGSVDALINRRCRICGLEGEWTIETSYCCNAEIDGRRFPFGGGTPSAFMVAREPVIRGAIAKLAREKATRIFVKCAGCGKRNVPDPDHLGREDTYCTRCYSKTENDRDLRRSVMRGRF